MFMLQGEKVLIRLFDIQDITKSYINWLNDAEVVRYSNQRFTNHTYESCVRYLSSFTETDNYFLNICRYNKKCTN